MAVADQVVTDRYAIYNGDCLDVLPTLPDGSLHLSVYSPPFATSAGGLYHYSSSDRDLSNSRSYGEFFEHYRFVVDEIYRLTMPGRMTAVHCMDVPTGNTGTDARVDFPGDIVRLHSGCRDPRCTAPQVERGQGLCPHGGGWRLVGRYFVWKEPLGVRNRTMAKNLAHQSIVQDSSRCANAGADCVLVFRRRGTNPVPIAHPVGLTEYAGSREVPRELWSYKGWTGKQTENRYSHWIWRQYASAFWDDVRIDRVLPYRPAREADDEKHVHPLQLDVIERIVTLWSNPGEVVGSPFAGVGSEAFSAVELGRRAVAAELKQSYFKQAVRNLALAGTGNREEQAVLFGAESPDFADDGG